MTEPNFKSEARRLVSLLKSLPEKMLIEEATASLIDMYGRGCDSKSEENGFKTLYLPSGRPMRIKEKDNG